MVDNSKQSYDASSNPESKPTQIPKQSVELIRSTLEDMRKHGLTSGLPQEHAFTLLEEIERLIKIANSAVAGRHAFRQMHIRSRYALRRAVEWAGPMAEAPVDSRPAWFDIAREALSGVAPDETSHCMHGRVVCEPCAQMAIRTHEKVREIWERHDRISKLLWGPGSLPGMMLGPMDADAAHMDRGALLSMLTPEQRGEIRPVEPSEQLFRLRPLCICDNALTNQNPACPIHGDI